MKQAAVFWPAGTVYGTLLNFRGEWRSLGDQVTQPPYKAAPKAPVLFVKTANTWSANGSAIPIPAQVPWVEVGASIAMVIGPPVFESAMAARRVSIAGYVLVNDLSVPHASFFRPPVKTKCLDGFLGLGPHNVPAGQAGDPAHFVLEVRINGELRQTMRCADLVRNAAQLLADVSDFMTLREGDWLLLGSDVGRALAQAGDRIDISVPALSAFGTLTHTLAAQTSPAEATLAPLPPRSVLQIPREHTKHARVAWAGAVHDAVEHDGQLLLADGRLVAQDLVVWLPPLQPTARARTILALGLNYADHAKELEFNPPEEPLVFIKGESTLIGHQAFTTRPAGVLFMHYECELVVVIGKTARKVRRTDAYDFIAGYSVANDYAIRDYLENWYRPNLRVKNRATCTPIGPWLVDASAVPDPMNLALQTTVNGRVTQSGNTRDMIFDLPFLIEYFSSFMTLQPGDLILTGTPDGVVDCQPGDVIITEIAGIGALSNTIVQGAR